MEKGACKWKARSHLRLLLLLYCMLIVCMTQVCYSFQIESISTEVILKHIYHSLTVLLNVFHWFAIYWVRTNCLALHIRPFMIFQKISLCPSRTSLFPGVWSLLSHLWVAPTLFFIILIFIVNLYGCFKTFSGVIQAVWFMEHFLEFSNTGCMPHFSHHTTFYFN